jgi:hypothetical protein
MSTNANQNNERSRTRKARLRDRAGAAFRGLAMASIATLGCDGPSSESPTAAPPNVPSGGTTPRFGVVDIQLRSGTTFSAESGSENPFNVSLSADVRSPSGRRLVVFGFFDGDGEGGAVGDVFKLRLYLDEEGTWTWTSRSDLPALHGLQGTVDCGGEMEGPFRSGPMVVAPENGRRFAFQESEAVYLIAKFLDVDAPAPLEFSHTFFSEALTDADRAAMLTRHRAMGVNRMNIYIANRGDYGGNLPTTPWTGSSDSNDKSRFALDRWHAYERWLLELRDAGIVAALWFFADDSRFGSLQREEEERLVSYAMARLSPLVNTIFILMLEWQEGWSADEVDRLGAFTQSVNPWNRMVSVHGRTGDFSFPDADWVDYLVVQTWNEPDSIYDAGLRNRNLAAKPLLNEEFALGEENALNRTKTWAAFMAGAAGSGTGAFLRPLSEFVAALDIAALQPTTELTNSPNAWALVDMHRTGIVYVKEGSEVSLDLSGWPGGLEARWYDPREGTYSSSFVLDVKPEILIETPDSGDWVLHIEAPAASADVQPSGRRSAP